MVKSFKIIKYNKLIQDKLDISIIDYKNYYEQIEIEITPINVDEKNYFINGDYKSYYHIYFNNSKNEVQQNYFNKDDNVTKINIILSNESKYLSRLIYYCDGIEKIKFKRNDINNMNGMFYGCSSLKKLKS